MSHNLSIKEAVFIECFCDACYYGSQEAYDLFDDRLS